MENRPSVRVKARRYYGDQREYLDGYMKTLLELGFFEGMSTASWQAAPLFVLKKDPNVYWCLKLQVIFM